MSVTGELVRVIVATLAARLSVTLKLALHGWSHVPVSDPLEGIYAPILVVCGSETVASYFPCATANSGGSFVVTLWSKS